MDKLEKKKASDAKYREKNRESLKEKSRQRRIKCKLTILDRYGKHCAICGFSDIRALQLDHVDGNGNQHRIETGGSIRFSGWRFYDYLIKQGLPDGYQVLCANCNMIKQLESVFD